MKAVVAKSFICIGVALFCIAFLGDTTHIGGYENTERRSWEQFDKALVSRTNSVEDLITEAKDREENYKQLSDEKKMIALYEVVIDRFTHNAGAKHTLFTNWLLYFLGKANPTLGTIMAPDIFVAKGHSLICSQSSYLLMQMALREGIVSRHVGLNGHVVMEAWYDDNWHLFDPDAEVVPRNSEGYVLSVTELSKSPSILRSAYSGVKGDFVHIISSRQDNSFVSYPKGAYFEWKTQVLFYLEKLAQILKYFISCFFTIFGIYMWCTRNKRMHSDGSSAVLHSHR